VTEIIVTRKMIVKSNTGSVHEAKIEIHTPIQNINEFSCDLDLQGIYDRKFTINGEDAFQALCLTISFLGKLINQSIKEGVVFYYEDGSEMDFSEIITQV
jgi:hypothetical protein